MLDFLLCSHLNKNNNCYLFTIFFLKICHRFGYIRVPTSLGKHIIKKYYGCPRKILDCPGHLNSDSNVPEFIWSLEFGFLTNPNELWECCHICLVFVRF